MPTGGPTTETEPSGSCTAQADGGWRWMGEDLGTLGEAASSRAHLVAAEKRAADEDEEAAALLPHQLSWDTLLNEQWWKAS